MPPPIKVELLAYDPGWDVAATREIGRLKAALGENLLRVHHVGSTAVPGIKAKPVIDLLPVVVSLVVFDAQQPAVEALGYGWAGELGLPGRRYCFRDDPESGKRQFQLHCYKVGSDEIRRHLAFRDHLRRHRQLARAYEAEKIRCQALHPDDSHAYSECKNAWIRKVEKDALRAFDAT